MNQKKIISTDNLNDEFREIEIVMREMKTEILREIRAIRKDNADFFARMLGKHQRRLEQLKKPTL